MKLHTDNHGFQGIVPSERIPFKIATNAKMFGILSDGIYKDKILAVIRELSCNAFDAHYVANQSTPFTVQVPTLLEPTFAVIDEGTGIDPTKIADIFWTYGTSSKSECNNQIGALGLGSKSPFAYTKSSFIVKNRYNGKEHTYFCFINEQGMPDGSEVSVEDTDVHSGITVELAVRQEDIYAFKTRIVEFFQYWKPEHRPSFINGSDLIFKEPEKTFGKDNWYLERNRNYTYNHGAKALMGGIVYPIDIKAIPTASHDLQFIAKNSFVIEFPIGALSFQVSREELSYEKSTIQSLELMAEKIVREFAGHIHHSIEKGADTPYQLHNNFHQVNHTLKELRLRSFDGYGIENPVVYFFDIRTTDTFKTTKGVEYNLTELRASFKRFNYNGYSNLNILEVQTNGTNKGSKAFRYVLKNTREVLLEKDTTQWCKPWYRPNIKHAVSVDGRSLVHKTVAELLGEGYVVSQTTICVDSAKEYNVNKTNIFVLNDMGLVEGSKLYREYLNNYNHDHHGCYLVTPEDKRSDYGRQEIEVMLEGSIFEGCLIILLSDIPEVKAIISGSSTPVSQPKEKSVIPVYWKTYTFKPSVKGHSFYSKTQLFGEVKTTSEVIVSTLNTGEVEVEDVSSFKGVYLIKNNSKDAHEHLINEYHIGWLLNSGLFDEYLVDKNLNNSKELEIYTLTETTVTRMIKKGAKLKSVFDIIKGYFQSPEYNERMGKYFGVLTYEGGYSNLKKQFFAVGGYEGDKTYLSDILKGVTSNTSLFKTTYDQLTTILSEINVEGSKLLYDMILTKSLKGYTLGATQVQTSDGDPVQKLFLQYPLLEALSDRAFKSIDDDVDTPSFRKQLVEDITDYINLKDSKKVV